MNILTFFIFLLGILLSIPFSLLLFYLITFHPSNNHIHHVKSSKSDILTIPHNDQTFHSVWMFAISNRFKFQAIYLKLYHQYLFIHLTTKPIKSFKQHKITFSEVLIYNLSQSKIELKPSEQLQSQYWSTKTQDKILNSFVLTQLQYLGRYRIDKNQINHQQDKILNSKVI